MFQIILDLVMVELCSYCEIAAKSSKSEVQLIVELCLSLLLYQTELLKHIEILVAQRMSMCMIKVDKLHSKLDATVEGPMFQSSDDRAFQQSWYSWRTNCSECR